MSDNRVTSKDELKQIVGEPSERAIKKDIARLDVHARDFIGGSPFLLMATSGAEGRCDVSPKGDAPGFVRVLDERRLVIPDRPGNKRTDGMRNILENPHIGLIFLVPGKEDTLRVNGRAWISQDPELLATLEAHGKVPQLAIVVEVEECFLHCPKAFRRSGLWDPATWTTAATLKSMAAVHYDRMKPEGKTFEQYARESEEGIRRTMY